MRPEIDLSLLRDSLIQLEETTYFSGRLHEFTKKLVEVITHVLESPSRYDNQTIYLFAGQISHAHRYLEGSTTKEAPYEMEYCLKSVLPSWVKRESLITTALTSGKDFHFLPADPWAFIKNAITGFNAGGFDPLLVLIGVPRLYVHKPLYCVPLYHEVGHFVDNTLGVTQMSFLLAAGSGSAVEARHRAEHFADLFAACYVGRTNGHALNTIAPHAAQSFTHPSTSDRILVVEAFLNGSAHPLVELFQACLRRLGAPPLAINYASPTITEELDDIRPYVIQSPPELHGLFASGWDYLQRALDFKTPPWSAGLSNAAIERTVNDLIEKSLRNHSIRTRWTNGAP